MEGEDGGGGEGFNAAAHATHLLGELGVGVGGRQGVGWQDAHHLWGTHAGLREVIQGGRGPECEAGP